MLVFPSVIENVVVLFPCFFFVFSHALVAFSLTTQKSRRAEKNFHTARSLQEIKKSLQIFHDLAMTNLIPNKREWNDCLIKFGTVEYLEIIAKCYRI